MLDTPNPEQLPELNSSDFLPRLGPWAILGGGLLVVIFGAAVVAAAILKYNVAVKVAATLRPAGELRIVQPAIEGTVEEILVSANQTVEQGQVIARIDDSRLTTNKTQLESDIQQAQLQLTQVSAQLNALEAQIGAEANSIQRSIQAAQAELTSQQRFHQTQQITAEAEHQEAIASLTFAQEELNRYQQLANSGAISDSQLSDKRAAVAVANARVERARANLNPTDAEIAKAQEQIAQTQAQGEASLAALRQQRQQLLQNQTELQSRIDRAQQELRQLESDFNQTVIRAPVAGTLLELNLRNVEQVVRPGEAVAYIAPADAPLVIRSQVPAQEIDNVEPGQQVQMQVSACPYPEYGTLMGTVTFVAPDALPASEGATSPASYEVTIEPQNNYVGTGDRQCQLQAGMEGKADIISRQETVLDFILRKARLISNV